MKVSREDVQNIPIEQLLNPRFDLGSPYVRNPYYQPPVLQYDPLKEFEQFYTLSRMQIDQNRQVLESELRAMEQQ